VDTSPRIPEPTCRNFGDIIEFVGKKWSAAILLALARGADRFGMIRAQIDGLSDRLLSARLQELMAEGLVVKHVRPTTPVSVTYALTDDGRDLLRALQPLIRWSGHRRSARADAA
jgi:DNA-binding HxlR family transcriptional regulator